MGSPEGAWEELEAGLHTAWGLFLVQSPLPSGSALPSSPPTAHRGQEESRPPGEVSLEDTWRHQGHRLAPQGPSRAPRAFWSRGERRAVIG